MLHAASISLAVAVGCSAAAQPTTADTVERIRAVSAAPVLGFDASGRLILGDAVRLDDGGIEGVAQAAVPFYDTILDSSVRNNAGCSPCLAPGSTVPAGLNVQSIADDLSFDPAFAGAAFDGFDLVTRLSAPDGVGAMPVLALVMLYETSTLDPAFDGSDGFDNDGDGAPDAPFLASSFATGVVLDFGLISAPQNPTMISVLTADGLASLGFDLAVPSGDSNGDGSIDATVSIGLFRSLDDIDGDGIIDSQVPVFGAEFFLGGTSQAFPASCFAGGQQPLLGSSTLGVWGEGADTPGSLADWSMGSVSPGVDGVFDPSVDLKLIPSPVPGCPELLAWAMRLSVLSPALGDALCADSNRNGVVEPSDFAAWTAAYNAGNLVADTNQNSSLDAGDFTAWIAAYNLGAAGPTCTP